MATAREAKKPIIHFGVKGQKKCVSVLCCFLLHIDLFTHSADMMAQGPSSHLYSHSTHGTLIKRLADRFTGITVNTSHQQQSILQSSILACWNRSRDQINDLHYHRLPVPFWDKHPGSGPQGGPTLGPVGTGTYIIYSLDIYATPIRFYSRHNRPEKSI